MSYLSVATPQNLSSFVVYFFMRQVFRDMEARFVEAFEIRFSFFAFVGFFVSLKFPFIDLCFIPSLDKGGFVLAGTIGRVLVCDGGRLRGTFKHCGRVLAEHGRKCGGG